MNRSSPINSNGVHHCHDDDNFPLNLTAVYDDDDDGELVATTTTTTNLLSLCLTKLSATDRNGLTSSGAAEGNGRIE